MRFKAGYPMRDFTLTLMQQDTRVAGQFEELPLESVAALSGVVSGGVSGYRVELVGKLSWYIGPDANGFTELQGFDATVAPGGTEATGTFTLADRHEDGSDFMQRECTIVWLERKVSTASDGSAQPAAERFQRGLELRALPDSPLKLMSWFCGSP